MITADSFEGKAVIVTGSSSGIGAVNASHFAKLGASVVVTGRNKERVEAVAEECRKHVKGKGKILAMVGSIDDDKFCEALVEKTVSEFGRLDVLVNNAGIGTRGKILQDPKDEYFKRLDDVYKTNLRAVLYLIHLSVPHLLKTRGNIVNVSSVAGKRPWEYGTAYCSLKAALDMMVKTLTLELAPKGIRVNNVNPAYVDTPMLFAGKDEQTIAKIRQRVAETYPLGRIGESQDISNSIVFLASDMASFITSHTLVVDGGSKDGQYTHTPPDIMKLLDTD